MNPKYPSTVVLRRAAPDLPVVLARARAEADLSEILDAENAIFLEENRRELERFTHEIDEVFGPIFEASDLPMLDRKMSLACARPRETEV